MSEPFMASIMMWAANFAPRNWAYCQGQTMNISQNTALFSLLGTTYGGDGRTTYMLPNLSSRAPIGTGQGAGLSLYKLGQLGGAESVTLDSSNLPPHKHALEGYSTPATTATPAAQALPAATVSSVRDSYVYAYATTGTAVAMGNTGVTGSGAPVQHVPPYLAINFIIAMQGLYPSRN